MMKRMLVALFLVAGLAVAADAGSQSTVRGTASAVKSVSTGVGSDLCRLGRVISFPIRHPKRSLHAVGTAVKDAGIAVVTVAVTIIGPGVPR